MTLQFKLIKSSLGQNIFKQINSFLGKKKNHSFKWCFMIIIKEYVISRITHYAQTYILHITYHLGKNNVHEKDGKR